MFLLGMSQRRHDTCSPKSCEFSRPGRNKLDSFNVMAKKFKNSSHMRYDNSHQTNKLAFHTVGKSNMFSNRPTSVMLISSHSASIFILFYFYIISANANKPNISALYLDMLI